MATRPQFSVAPIVASGVLASTKSATSWTTPTHTTTLFEATCARQITGTITTGSTTLTSSTVQLGDVGRPVSSSTAGIPAGTIIVSVTAGTSAVLSAKATASHSTIKVTLGGGIGAKVEEIDFLGNGTTVAGLAGVFLKTPAGAFIFQGAVKITAVTASASTVNFGATPNVATGKWRPPNMWVPPGYTLCVAGFFVTSQKVIVTAYAAAF